MRTIIGSICSVTGPEFSWFNCDCPQVMDKEPKTCPGSKAGGAGARAAPVPSVSAPAPWGEAPTPHPRLLLANSKRMRKLVNVGAPWGQPEKRSAPDRAERLTGQFIFDLPSIQVRMKALPFTSPLWVLQDRMWALELDTRFKPSCVTFTGNVPSEPRHLTWKAGEYGLRWR